MDVKKKILIEKSALACAISNQIGHMSPTSQEEYSPFDCTSIVSSQLSAEDGNHGECNPGGHRSLTYEGIKKRICEVNMGPNKSAPPEKKIFIEESR